MKDKEIGILLGGVSAEREISLKTGDAKAAMSQFGRTGKVGCGGCHGTYRAKKK